EGTIQSSGQMTGTGVIQPPGGGPITVVAGCSLIVGDTGVVSSEGRDPGADLVHLEGCTVVINGVVRSSGSGHAPPNNPANHCGRPDRNNKPSNATAWVEIWSGDSITIDATGSHSGQIDADVGMAGGTLGTSWIDVFARGDVVILGGTSSYAVHANMTLVNGRGGGGRIVSHAWTLLTAGVGLHITDPPA